MSQRDSQLLFVVEAGSVAEIGDVLALLLARGVGSATLDLRLGANGVTIGVVAPATLVAHRALQVGADLAAYPPVRSVEIHALDRRSRATLDGAMVDRRVLATWSPASRRPQPGALRAA